jgi:hypothetical protein
MAGNVLKVDGMNESLWLVKIPKSVAEAWSEAQDNDDLGSLSITKTNTGAKKLNVSLGKGGLGTEGLKDYILEELTSGGSQDKKLLAFSFDGTSYELSGKCTKSFYMKPQDNSLYHNVLRKRTESAKPSHETQILDPSVLSSMPPSSSYVIDMSLDGVGSKRKLDDDDIEFDALRKSFKGSLDHDNLRSKVFEMFTKCKNLTTNDIFRNCNDISGLTKDSLLKFLKLYCHLETKGPLKNNWMLKSEYQISSK